MVAYFTATRLRAFTPRPRPPEPAAPVPLAGPALRACLENAAQTALDAADKIIAALDRLDGSEATQEIETLRPRARPTPPHRSRRSSAWAT